MIVEHVWLHVLLNRWGKFALRSAAGGLGFARMSLIAGDGSGEGHYDPAPPPDVTGADYDAVTKAVETLDNELIRAINGYYVIGQGKAFYTVAREIGINRITLGKRIIRAHRLLVPLLEIKRHNHHGS